MDQQWYFEWKQKSLRKELLWIGFKSPIFTEGSYDCLKSIKYI